MEMKIWGIYSILLYSVLEINETMNEMKLSLIDETINYQNMSGNADQREKCQMFLFIGAS